MFKRDLGTKVNWHFYDMVKIRSIYESLLRNIIKSKKFPTIYQNITKVPGKIAIYGFSYKERSVVLTVHKLFEHNN